MHATRSLLHRARSKTQQSLFILAVVHSCIAPSFAASLAMEQVLSWPGSGNVQATLSLFYGVVGLECIRVVCSKISIEGAPRRSHCRLLTRRPSSKVLGIVVGVVGARPTNSFVLRAWRRPLRRMSHVGCSGRPEPKPREPVRAREWRATEWRG